MTKADELTKRIKNALVYGTSHPEAYMTKIDELWEKYYLADEDFGHFVRHQAFIAALTEYGEHIKAEAVKVCEAEYTCEGIAQRCAAAIAKMDIK